MSNVLITGGTRGIGLGIATELASKGFNLALNGVRRLEEVQQVLEDLKKFDVDIIYCPGDVADTSDRERILHSTLDHFGTLHALVNNAGVGPKERTDILDVSEESFDRIMNINLKGAFFLSQQVARHMLSAMKNAKGEPYSIINISSISATVASANRSEYCISKSGMSMMTKLFASRLGEHDIMVYEIQPGIIETDMTSGVLSTYKKRIENNLNIQKRIGQPVDVGKAVTALLEGSLPYSPGQVLVVDGGLTVQRL